MHQAQLQYTHIGAPDTDRQNGQKDQAILHSVKQMDTTDRALIDMVHNAIVKSPSSFHLKS